MLDFKQIIDLTTGQLVIETSLYGKALLSIPQLNKGTAFDACERENLGLLGKLPACQETLAQQVARAYLQFQSYHQPLQQNIYLNNLHDKNQVLFYQLISEHLTEMLPIIYTPIIGTAVQYYSHNFRQSRGLYIAYEDRDSIAKILANRTNPNIELIVITDGEGVLGIGDQGIGGMDIPIAKLMVYTLLGGIDPLKTLPIFLDVGTNNQQLLKDPLYLGRRHVRVIGQEYDEFIAQFIQAVIKQFPNVFLHWEDFGRQNARRLLDKYHEHLCTFNDDIQGTGAVTLSALMAGCQITQTPLSEQRIVVFGAGSAGTGISDQILEALIIQGLSKTAAYKNFWLIDRQGLLLESDQELTIAQQPYARAVSDLFTSPHPALLEVITVIKPTILIGCSAQPGAFTQEVIETMASYCERPMIFPLSNPDDRCEVLPMQVVQWTKGKALIATGTGFPPVFYDERFMVIAQCNNALVFPGIGLGILAVKASRLSNLMLWRAVNCLAQAAPCLTDPRLPLLPALTEAQHIAKIIALAVAETAVEEGLATVNADADLRKVIEKKFWTPHYLPIRFKKS